jgi:ATP-dependent DNA helicase RecG
MEVRCSASRLKPGDPMILSHGGGHVALVLSKTRAISSPRPGLSVHYVKLWRAAALEQGRRSQRRPNSRNVGLTPIGRVALAVVVARLGLVSLPTRALTHEDVARLLLLEEGHFLELKSVEATPAALTRTMAALANTDGGELYVGLAEQTRSKTRMWNGFASIEDANGHLQIMDKLFPLGAEFSYEFLCADTVSGFVLRIAIAKSGDVKVAANGMPYVRRGAQNLQVRTVEARERLQRAKGLTSFETQTVDINAKLLLESRQFKRFLKGVVPSAQPRPWLAKQGLLRENHPTVAAILLFADEPQAVLPKRSAIKVYQYETSDERGSRTSLAFNPITIEGSLYDQIKRAVEQTAELIEAKRVIGATGLERLEYPTEALHEVITNAVLHRDYAVADDVHVRIFNNRVEVESPGRLPAHVTVRNILRERFARNGTVVRIINKFPDPPNKDVGEGLRTAFDAMKRHRLKAPKILEDENSVVVQLRHERLGTPEETVLEYLETHEEVNNATARDLTGIGSENKVKRVFERLIAAGEIERVPGKRGRAIAYHRTGRDRPKQLTLDEVL